MYDQQQKLRRDLRGINPKLSLHQTITKQLEDLGQSIARKKEARNEI